MSTPNRRHFLEAAAWGTAVVSMPSVFGCSQRAIVAGPATAASVSPSVAKGYFDAFGLDAGVISRVIGRGLSRGGDFCELFAQHRVSHWLTMEDGEINRANAEVALGVGVRVLKGNATGYAFSEDLSEEALMKAASTAAVVADGPATLEPKALAAVAVNNRYSVPMAWSEVGIDKKLPIVVAADKAARGADARVVKVRVTLEDETTRVLIANSDGHFIEDDRPMTTLSVSCVAEQGGKTETSGQSIAERDGIGFYTADRISKVAREAAANTVLLFEAEQPPAGEYPIVLASGIPAILLHEAIGHGMEADFNRKGTSIYAERMGKRIAPSFVTILDDGTNERMRGSINIDDEGTPAQRTVLVENGILRSYMHDRISAGHYKVARTGSARRESFRYAPVPRMRNTYMLAGPHKPEEIIASVKRGLYAEMFSNGQVQIGAGDFTFYLKHGRMIEDGKLTRVVKDANLIGNGPSVLEKVEMVGSDLTFKSGAGYCGKDGQSIPVGFGMPTIKASGMSVGGKRE
jgi:TldD protein